MKKFLTILLPVFFCMGCATAPMETARLSSPWAPKPMFTITLHCPGNLDASMDEGGAWMEESEEFAGEPGALDEADYECFSLLETMQEGAMLLLPQARFEPRR